MPTIEKLLFTILWTLLLGGIVSAQAIGVRLRSSRGIGVYNNLFNVKDIAYGAKGDCSTDDTTAIQKAFTTACATANSFSMRPSVFLPATPHSCYKVSSPIITSCPYTVPIFGDSSQTTSVATVSNPNYFPIFLNYPSTYVSGLGTITAASLATGKGYSLAFPQTPYWYLNLDDATPAQMLNALTALTFEGYFKWSPDPSTSSGTYVIFASGGNDGANLNAPNPTQGNATPHIYLEVGGNGSTAGRLMFSMDISGTITTISVASAVTKNTSHHIAAVLDPNSGAPLMRLFVDGTSIGTASPGIGGIKQLADETMTLGGDAFGPGQWPDGGGSNAWMGQMDSIRISNIARYTSNFTAPTAKFTADAHTLFLENFVNVGTHNTPATALIQTTVPKTNSYLVVHTGTKASQGAALTLKHLQLKNGAYSIMTIATPGNVMEDIAIVGPWQAGIYLSENSYSSQIDRISVDNSHNIGIATVAVADATIRNYQTTGNVYDYVAQSGGHIYGMLLAASANAVATFVLQCDTEVCGYLISGIGIDNESGTASIPVKIAGSLGNFVFNGFDMQTALNAPGIYINTFGVPASLAVTLEGVTYEGSSSTPEIIHYLSKPTMVNWINPIINGTPWASNKIPITDSSAVPYVNIIGGLPNRSTIVNLPTCGAALTTLSIDVTDCDSCTFGVTCQHTTGSTFCHEICNGKAWVAQ